jgi:HSP20 family protein
MKDSVSLPRLPVALSAPDEDGGSAELLRALGWGPRRRGRAWRPPTDVYETDSDYVVVVEVAGMRGVELGVSFEEQTLSIRGRRPDIGGGKAYHQMEISYGEFLVDVYLHSPVDHERIEATYRDGFLRVVLPKAHPKTIPISS